MSKVWYVKVDVPVYFMMDCNLEVTTDTEEKAREVAEDIVREELVMHGHYLSKNVPWDLGAGVLSFSRSGDLVPMLDNVEACHAELATDEGEND
jgi:hypothetical protein